MRRRLAGEIEDISSSGEGEQPSTGAVESGPSVIIRNLSSTTALVTPSEWLVTDDLTEEVQVFLQYFHNFISGTRSTKRERESSPKGAVHKKDESKVASKSKRKRRSAAKKTATTIEYAAGKSAPSHSPTSAARTSSVPIPTTSLKSSTLVPSSSGSALADSELSNSSPSQLKFAYLT